MRVMQVWFVPVERRRMVLMSHHRNSHGAIGRQPIRRSVMQRIHIGIQFIAADLQAAIEINPFRCSGIAALLP
jgi:hypothetical protein